MEINSGVLYQRTGVTNMGFDFESTATALFSLRLLHDPEVVDFSLNMNVQGFGQFDDLIVLVKLIDGTELNFAIQLRHKENTQKRISAAMLEAVHGNFSLQKYWESTQYDALLKEKLLSYNCILYTNVLFDLKAATNLTQFDAQLKNCPGRDWFDTSCGNENIYGFQINSSVTETQPSDWFFKRFTFYVSQKNVRGLKEEIYEFLENRYGCDEDVVIIYLNFFRENSNARIIRAATLRYQLLYVLLKPHLAKLVTTSTISHQYLLLTKCIMEEFNVTLLNGFDKTQIYKFQENGIRLEDDHLLSLAKKNNFSFISKNLTPDLKRKILGYLGEPLVVIVDEGSIYNIINSLHRHSKTNLVLVGEGLSADKFDSRLKIFENLGDLSVENQTEIIKEFNISLQERELDLGIAGLIPIADVIQNVEDDFLIGDKKEELPNFYISRSLCRSIDESKIFGELTVRVKVICSEPGSGKSTLLNYFKNHCPKTHWAIKIDVNHHQAVFEKISGYKDFLKYLINSTSKNFKHEAISTKVMQFLIDQNRCFFYWDGLDNIEKPTLKSVIAIVQELESHGYYQWIAARSNLKEILEEKLNVSAFDIEAIDIYAEQKYIKQRLGKSKSEGEIDHVLNRLYSEHRKVICKSPLELYTLTEQLLQGNII